MIATLLWELRQRRSALLWWTLGSVILTGAIILLYPSIRDQAAQLNKVINQLPPGLRELKAGTSGTVDVGQPIEFLNSQLFYATLPILWIIMSVTRGSAVLGRDEQNHTLELLLARPISRGTLLFAKALSLATEFVVVGAATLATIVLLAPLFSLHIATMKLVAATVYTVLFSMSFGFIAFTLQAASNLARRGASAVAVLLGVGGYILTSMSGLTHWLTAPARFAPYHYFAPNKIMHGQPHTGLSIYLAGVLVFTIAASYVGFRRRDIQ